MYNPIIAWLRGYLEIRIQGRNVERLLNFCANSRLDLWDIREIKTGIQAKIAGRHFVFLRPFARKTHTKVHILRRFGLPFMFDRLLKRQGLIWGGVMFCVALYVLSSFVWFVEVRGAEQIESGLVLEIVRSEGLYPGAWRGGFAPREIEDQLMVDCPDIMWVNIRQEGTRVVVDLVEKQLPTPDVIVGPSNLVAASDGVIQKIVVLSGTAEVHKGDSVQVGQVLIDGSWTADGAKGVVEATVSRRATAVLELEESERIPTGARAVSWYLGYNGDKLISYGPNYSPYRHSNLWQADSDNRFWRKYNIPVEFYIKVYSEVILETEEVGLVEAITRFKAENPVLFPDLPLQAKIVSQREEIDYISDKEVEYSVIMETIEHIGVEVAVP